MGRSRYSENGPVDEMFGLARSVESGNIGDEWGRRGTIWADIERGRGATGSRKVFRWFLDLWDTI